jgi:hypothetical protein
MKVEEGVEQSIAKSILKLALGLNSKMSSYTLSTNEHVYAQTQRFKMPYTVRFQVQPNP